jgi:hypothetical protein
MIPQDQRAYTPACQKAYGSKDAGLQLRALRLVEELLGGKDDCQVRVDLSRLDQSGVGGQLRLAGDAPQELPEENKEDASN